MFVLVLTDNYCLTVLYLDDIGIASQLLFFTNWSLADQYANFRGFLCVHFLLFLIYKMWELYRYKIVTARNRHFC